MTLARTFLNRHGKINGRAYWINCAVLLCVGVGIHLLAFGLIYAINPNMINIVSSVLEKIGIGMFGIETPSLLLISLLFYPYLCLYTKRLRDIGVSAYWYIAVLITYIIGFHFVGMTTYGFLALLHFSPTDFFLNKPLPGASEEEIIAGIVLGTQKMLIAIAIFQASVHAVVTIVIDVVLGKVKPRSRQKPIATNGMALA